MHRDRAAACAVLAALSAFGCGPKIASSVPLWRIDHPDDGCRDVASLRRGGTGLDDEDPSTDAWGRELRLTCEGGHAVVSSAGADGQLGTADDITAREIRDPVEFLI